MMRETAAIEDVLAERRRQVEGEGFSPRHDDHHSPGELARAGACYAVAASQALESHIYDPPPWPWADAWWKPKTPRRDLVRASALLIAEIERLDRMAGDA